MGERRTLKKIQEQAWPKDERRIASMWILRKVFGLKLEAIGRLFGVSAPCVHKQLSRWCVWCEEHALMVWV